MKESFDLCSKMLVSRKFSRRGSVGVMAYVTASLACILSSSSKYWFRACFSLPVSLQQKEDVMAIYMVK